MPKRKKSASSVLRGEEVVAQKRSEPAKGPVSGAAVRKAVGVKGKKRSNLAQRVVRAIGRASPQAAGINEANRQLSKVNEENKKKRKK
jgi:hypothetical protein